MSDHELSFSGSVRVAYPASTRGARRPTTGLILRRPVAGLSPPLTCEPGDALVWLFRTNNGGNMMQIYNFELATGGELLHPTEAFFTFGSEPN